MQKRLIASTSLNRINSSNKKKKLEKDQKNIKK